MISYSAMSKASNPYGLPPGWDTLGEENDRAADFYHANAAFQQSQGLTMAAQGSQALADKLYTQGRSGPQFYGFANPLTPVAPFAQHNYSGPAAYIPTGPAAVDGGADETADAGGSKGFAGNNARVNNDFSPTAFSRPFNGGAYMPPQSGELGPYAHTDINSNNNVTPLKDGRGWVSMPNPTPDQMRNPSHLPGGVYYPNKWGGQPIVAYSPFDNSDKPAESGPDILRHYTSALGNGQVADPQWVNGPVADSQWVNDPRNPYAGFQGKGGGSLPAYAITPPKGMGQGAVPWY